MYKKFKKSSADFLKAARKKTKTLQIENPGVDKAVKTSAFICIATAGAVAAPFIPAVTAAVGGAAALTAVGLTTQNGIARDMDKELKTWYNLSGQRVRSSKEYENYFHTQETEMLRLALKLIKADTDKERTKIEDRISDIRAELTDFANDFKVIIVNTENESLSEPYKLLDNQSLMKQAQERTTGDLDRAEPSKPPRKPKP